MARGQAQPCATLTDVAPAVGRPESSGRAVADMEDIHLLLLFQHAVDHAVDVRLAAEQQMRKLLLSGVTGHRLGVFSRLETSSWRL
jgi:hypothetical protein